MGVVSRLRAALTPQACALLLALALAAAMLGDRGGEGAAALEVRAQRALSRVSGAGEVFVVIRMRAKETGSAAASFSAAAEQIPCGAIAVAQGADDPFVCAQLTQALSALLGVPPSSVSVIKGEGRYE